ncbi:LysR family transcriptional regulator [Pseudovibrio sp. SCP19]|uniref:LysR family transcriptional regulator n=1 Tax=Pseudovibrio sp. SCP19 TaxID=3141374 RepID=UPI00333DD671
MLNSQWLRTFVKLTETGHFTQTANQLGMTQPGVSQHLKKLELQIGAPLITKIGKGFELTREGELLLSFALTAEKQEAELREAIQQDDPNAGEIRIACSGSMALYLYPKLLAHQNRHPGLTLKVEVAPNHRSLQLLQSNEMDLCIVTQQAQHSALEQQHIGNEPLCLVVPANFKEKAVAFEDLQKLGFIDHPDGQHYAERLLTPNFEEMASATDDLRVTGYINQLSQILVPVAKGLGYTVLPKTAVRSFEAQQKIKILELKEPVSDPLYLTVKKHRPLPARYDWFLQEIAELCGQMSGS